MPRQLKLSDTELVKLAFEDYKREQGFGDSILMRHLDTQSIRVVLGRAQTIKQRLMQEKRA